MYWQIARQKVALDRPLVMGILNVTPDSFSDGGRFASQDDAIAAAERLVAEGADILDIGGESTRPGSARVSTDEEIRRTVPLIKELAERVSVPISIDTTRSVVAAAAVESGAQIINDISGLRFDDSIAAVAAETGAGLVMMHSRGEFDSMHSQPAVDDILSEVTDSLRWSINKAREHGVKDDAIMLDVGLGFGKTFEQNLELVAKLGRIVDEFKAYPILVGASRKSFIGKILGGVPASERLGGSIAMAVIAAERGAAVVRVHDVKETAAALRTLNAIRS